LITVYIFLWKECGKNIENNVKKLLSLDHCSSLIYYGNVLKKEYQKLFSDIIHTVKGFYKNDLVSCAIFGSVARDTATPESDIDFIPTEEYTEEDARQFMKETAFVVETALRLF
jgi:predicted nucleotidyltransferase